ncbi:hypothetical protein FRB99_003141 [Tulasnella sp. 403]|nr:hypothetical protein FRB99_003141 [Tulasnella sp. 403]
MYSPADPEALGPEYPLKLCPALWRNGELDNQRQLQHESETQGTPDLLSDARYLSAAQGIMSSDQRSLDDHDDADDAIGSASTDGYSSDAMSESPSTPPSDGQDSNGLRGASGSEPATRLGTPPASSSYPTSDDASMSSSRAPSVYTFDSSGRFLLTPTAHQVKYVD